jgi:hypothetical protein
VRSPEDAPTFYDAPVEDATPHDGTFPDARMPSACDGAPGRSLSVLFVGNSQIDFWNMARLVSSLSESAPPGCPRIVGTKHTLGGANLRDLWERTDLASHIATGGYDAVVITESIDLADMRPPFPEHFEEYARRVVDATRATGSEPLFYATAYVETPTRFGFAEMADPQLALGAELGGPVATGGLAWLRAWERTPELDLYHPDRGHPGYLGSYLSALVLWGDSSRGEPHRANERTGHGLHRRALSRDQPRARGRAASGRRRGASRALRARARRAARTRRRHARSARPIAASQTAESSIHGARLRGTARHTQLTGSGEPLAPASARTDASTSGASPASASTAARRSSKTTSAKLSGSLNAPTLRVSSSQPSRPVPSRVADPSSSLTSIEKRNRAPAAKARSGIAARGIAIS